MQVTDSSFGNQRVAGWTEADTEPCSHPVKRMSSTLSARSRRPTMARPVHATAAPEDPRVLPAGPFRKERVG